MRRTIAVLALGVGAILPAAAAPPGLTDFKPKAIEAIAMDMTGVARLLHNDADGKAVLAAQNGLGGKFPGDPKPSDCKGGACEQKQQQQVVQKLDKLIEMLECECKCCCNGSGTKPNKPAAKSTLRKGNGKEDLASTRNGNKKWAELPAHQRDRILQSMNDGFPAEYQGILESYYRRLAEEQSAEAAPKSAAKKQ